MTDADFAEFEATLRDGRTVRLRPMRAEDEAEFLQAFERMSAQARYMRFMHPVRHANVGRVRKALATLGDAMVGVVATVPAADGYDIAGSAIVVLEDDRTRGEFAITVGEKYARTGLGTLVMNTLIDAARRRGVREITGYVLAENRPMLGLAARLGFRIAMEPGDATVRVCRLELVPG